MPANHSQKIVHFTSGHLPSDTRVFLKECRSLQRGGYEVVLLVPHTSDEFSDGVQIKASPVPQNRFDRFTVAPRQLYRECLRQNARAYHFHDPELIPTGLMLRLRGKCVIYDVHDDTPATFIDKDYIPRLLRIPLMWLARVLENAAARQFSAIVAATPAIAERFEPLNRRTVVIHNFALPDELACAASDVPWRERPPLVAYVGGLSRERGITEVVRSLSLLPESFPARLAFAGWFAPKSLRNEVAMLPGWERVDELRQLRDSRKPSQTERNRFCNRISPHTSE